MTRTEAIRTITDFMGPLGPFQDPEERDLREETWATEVGAETLEQILDLVMHPPLAGELDGIDPNDFEYELSRILTMIGARAPSEFLVRVGPLLDNARARPTIIEVIGTLGLDEGLAWLERLTDNRGLAEEDAVRLACALGEIGGAAALPLLDRIEDATPPERKRVRHEIAIARDAARRATDGKT